ncbi:MAG: hypothetical protein ACOCZE_06740 [Planctomycetota bacterium]
MKHIFPVTVLLACLAGASGLVSAAGPVSVVSATPFGSSGTDWASAVALGKGGEIYVAGRLGEQLDRLGGKAPALKLGRQEKGWKYGRAFVARFSADGRTLEAWAVMAPGACRLTALSVGPDGQVYAAGYAGPGLEPAIADLGGLQKTGRYDQRDYKLHTPVEHHDEPRRSPDNDQRGVPVVLRFSADLTKLTAGTLLEGWQSTWHVPRTLNEDHWQPTLIGILAGGDVVVCHDGGYAARPAEGETIGYEHFYYIPDHISRLSPDLSQRRWHRRLQMPRIGRETIQKAIDAGRTHTVNPPKIQWKHDSIGQTRPFRLAVDREGKGFYLAGWSASRTSNEPWWTPFALGFDGSGKEVFQTYTPNPMSGGGGRMGGLVSDAAIRSIRLDAEGNILIAGIGDGGNSILRQDPRDYTKPAPRLRGSVHSFPGRVLFWGMVARIDRTSGQLLGGDHLMGLRQRRYKGTRTMLSEAWATDLAGLEDGRVLVIGRQQGGFHTTENAFSTSGPGGLVRLYAPDFRLLSSSTFDGAAPMELAVSGNRAVLVGRINAEKPLSKEPAATPGGRTDALLMVLEVQSP